MWRSIGLEIVRGLVAAGARVVMGSRDVRRGEEAAAGLAPAGGVATARGSVLVRQLDVADAGSVARFATDVGEIAAAGAGDGGGLRVLVNNAGVAFKGDTFGVDETRVTLGTNLHGTAAVTHALLPLLRRGGPGARIVNVCSQAGRLGQVRAEQLGFTCILSGDERAGR